MHGTRWFSFKHNAWAVVNDEPITDNGFYTVELETDGENLKLYRRYNAERINREVSMQADIDAQLARQGVPGGTANGAFLPINRLSVFSQLDTPIGEYNSLTEPTEQVSNVKTGKVIGLIFE